MKLLFVVAAVVAVAVAAPAPKTTIDSITVEELQQLAANPKIKHWTLTEKRFSYANATRCAGKRLSPGYAQFDFVMADAIFMGTPPVKFVVSIETGVPLLALIDSEYPDPPEGLATYNEKESSTSSRARTPFSISSGGVTGSGKAIDDIIQLDDEGELTYHQFFGSLTSFKFPGGFPLSGILGLGWNPDKSSTPSSTAAPVVNILNALEADLLVYTLFMPERTSGMILWGQPLPVEPFDAINVGGAAGFNIESFQFKDYESHVAQKAVVDTGFSTIVLPDAQYRAVVKAVQPKFNDALGVFVVDCGDETKRPAKLVFTINKQKYEVRQNHYIIDRDFPGEQCLFAVEKSTDGITRLGLPFVRTVAVVFDAENHKLGFARIR